MHLAVDVGLGGGCLSCPLPSSMTFTSRESSPAEAPRRPISFSFSRLPCSMALMQASATAVFRSSIAVFAEAHQLGHRGRRAHGHLLEAHPRRQPDLDAGGFDSRSCRHLRGLPTRGTAPVRSYRPPAGRLRRTSRWRSTMHREYHRPSAPGTRKLIQKPFRTKFLIPFEDFGQSVGVKKQPRPRCKPASLAGVAHPRQKPRGVPAASNWRACSPGSQGTPDCARR